MVEFTLPRSGALRARFTQLASFGLIGGIAFVVDVGIYNLLRATLLDDKPIGAKIVSVVVATAVAWIGNRYLTFRGERGESVLREGLLFAGANVVGLLVSAACLFVSHYLLGFTSQLADNIAGNGVGLVLGTAFRFVAYRFIVFRPVPGSELPADTVDRVPAAAGVIPVPSRPPVWADDLAPLPATTGQAAS